MTSTEPRPDVFDPHTDEPVAEQLLLAAARDGSTGAFGILYARHRDYAVATARRALPAAEASHAEDVAETAFIRTFTALRNGSGPTDALRFYLATAVRREAWRTQRRRRRQAQVIDRWAVDEAAARRADEVIDLSADGQDLDAHVLLGEAFRALSDRWRHVLWLTEVEGRKPAEIAPMLGVSAGSASALAYRARQGLLAAYLNAYRDNGADEVCQELTERLGLYVAAGRIAEGFEDVVGHLEGCRRCRDVSRGVDVMGGVLSGLAPFGLLTAGLWAKGVAAGVSAGAAVGTAGAAALAGAGAAHLAGAGAAGAGAGAAGAGAAAGAAGASSAGAGVGTAVAVAVAVAAVVAGAYAGFHRNDSPDPAASAPPATVQTEVRGTDTSSGKPDRPPATAPATATTGAAPVTVTTTSRAPASTTVPGPAPATTAPATTEPRGATTTSSSSTTASTTTTTTDATTSTTQPPLPPRRGVLSGGALVRSTMVGVPDQPVSGIKITVFDGTGAVAGEALTASDGHWLVPALPPGQYQVLATVPSAYAPEFGHDPWAGGPAWQTTIGVVDLSGGHVDLVDLRLVAR